MIGFRLLHRQVNERLHQEIDGASVPATRDDRRHVPCISSRSNRSSPAAARRVRSSELGGKQNLAAKKLECLHASRKNEQRRRGVAPRVESPSFRPMRIAVLHAGRPPSQGSPPNSNSCTPRLREEAQEDPAKEIPRTTGQGVRALGFIQQ